MLVLSIIPLMVLSILSLNFMENMENTAIQNVGDMQENAVNNSLDSLNELGTILIKNQAMAAKALVELYIKTHPEKTAADLINDTEFQNIAVQPIGKKGYTVVALTRTQNLIAHPNTAMMGIDLLESLQKNERMQDWWRVVKTTWENNTDSSGYYQWPESDGTYSNKYMYVSVVDLPLQGQNLSVAATTYTDEFNAPAKFLDGDLTARKNDIVNDIQDRKRRIQQIIIIAAVFLFLAIVVLSILFSNKVTKPIKKLKDIADRITEGDLTVKTKISSNDEIGELGKSFGMMVNALMESRELLKQYSKDLERKVKERTERLERANERLKELDKEKDEFISIAAHELKTPLTSIKGFAQLLNTEEILNDKKKQKHYLDLINQNTIRLYDLVLDVVDCSRLSLGRLKLDIKNIEVNPIFNEIKENIGVIIREKRINPVFSIEENTPKIQADAERLLQVIRNLLINAIHFTPEKGTITFKITKKDKFVQFEIRDTGEGISKDKKDKIFSRFYQADQTLTRKVEGSGLGLSICKGLVEMMKGKIWFETQKGKGTIFYFTIPIAGNKRPA